MATSFIPTFGTKDPDEKLPKGFDVAGALAELGNPTVLGCQVIVDPTATNAAGVQVANDDALVISNVLFDSVKKLITFVWSGGTLGWTYTLTGVLLLGPDWRIDQSATVTIANR